MRRKNPHPKRAVNARTTILVVVKGTKDEEEAEELIGLFFALASVFSSCSFLFCKTSQFFFSKTLLLSHTLYALRKNLFLLRDDDAFKEEQQQQQQHATTTAKESTSEKSGEREDGFEGTWERRIVGVCVFEDS